MLESVCVSDIVRGLSVVVRSSGRIARCPLIKAKPVCRAYGGQPCRLAVLMVALAAGGCSFKLDSVMASGKGDDDAIQTGSIKKVSTAVAIDGLPKGRDLVLTHAAVRDALSRGGKDISLPWENPQTGARGTVTPLKTAHVQDGRPARTSLPATCPKARSRGCRVRPADADKGAWKYRTLTPWRRS